MNRAERVVRRVDRYQQQHAVLGFPFAVMQKYGNDQAGARAALVAYYGLFALFPLLLLFTTILGWVLHNHEALRNDIINSALANFPVIGPQLKQNVHAIEGNGWALVVGIFGTIYGGLGVVQAAQVAMNSVWNVPYVTWPNFFMRRIRGLVVAALFGVAILGSATLGILATAVAHGFGAKLLLFVGSAAISFGVFLAAFMVLTAEPLGWHDVWLGALLATAFWMTLQLIGGWYVGRALSKASPIYGTLALVIALLSWLFVGVQTTLFAAEINVVRNFKLWPRSMVQPPLTDADKRTFDRLARMEVRRPEVGVKVFFHDIADHDPLSEPAPGPASEAGGEAEGAPS
ncbi:MAG TPA: YihY/virulence factor BrkB family protein [Acidimicrobiales bacterium]|nr:YihY/virulence factor BrkB family protein [Acidimicrobiales bacterium]